MGLSNYVPNSRIAQPGVCTSTTRPATPYEGQVIYETDTNRVLVYDASAWVMIADTDQPPGLQLVKTYTITSANTVQTFSDAFSADFSSYRIVGSKMSAVAIAGLNMRMGTTNSGYYSSAVYADSSSVAATGANNGAEWPISVLTTTAEASIVIDLHNPFDAIKTTFQASGSDARTSGGYALRYAGGFINNTTSYTSFSFYAGSNINAGTVRVYGYRD